MQCPPSSPPRELAAAAAAAAKLLPGFSPSQGAGAGKGKGQPFTIYQDPELPHMANFYPTPLPTSQADASSPSRSPAALHSDKPVAPAAASTAGRVALSQLAFVKLPLDGSTVTVGRSSKSSMVPLAATNKLVSRVHAKVHYDPGRLIVIECLGWNGLTVYVPCIIDNARVQKEYSVVKDQTIYIERVDGVSLNIHGERVIIEIEQPEQQMHSSEATEDEFPEISALPSSPLSKSDDDLAARIAKELGNGAELAEPIALHRGGSYSNDQLGAALSALTPELQPPATSESICDAPLSSIPEVEKETTPAATPTPTPTVSSQPTAMSGTSEDTTGTSAPEVFAPSTTQLVDTTVSRFSESTPETNATPQQVAVKTEVLEEAKGNEKAKGHASKPKKRALNAATPTAKRAKLSAPTSGVDSQEISRQAINFVAFSRLASTPLSMVAESSPELADIPIQHIESALVGLPFIGVIRRTGKDALGKPLPNEYYYIPENDEDLTRRQIVAESKGARTLRSCRKTHKQYFYKKPRV